MKSLGIDCDSGEIFLGAPYRARKAEAEYSIIPVKMFPGAPERLSGPKIDHSFASNHVFQEISFDSVTRIRRGYIWRRSDSQPQDWGIGSSGGERLLTFGYQSFGGVIGRPLPDRVVFTFGEQDDFTIGELVHFERDVFGKELMTIRMRSQFALLPRVIWELIPGNESERVELEDALSKVIEGYRSSPAESVIDRCRDAITVALRIRLKLHGTGDKTDLSKLALRYEKDAEQGKRTVIGNLAHTVARLHARGKPTEKLDKPPIAEAQAELAVNSLAEVLILLGWAKW